MLQMMSFQNLAEQHEYVFVPHVFISNRDICTQITSKLINIDVGKVSSTDNISKFYQCHQFMTCILFGSKYVTLTPP